MAAQKRSNESETRQAQQSQHAQQIQQTQESGQDFDISSIAPMVPLRSQTWYEERGPDDMGRTWPALALPGSQEEHAQMYEGVDPSLIPTFRPASAIVPNAPFARTTPLPERIGHV